MPKIVITEESLPEVLNLIRTWKGKLTWPLLCEQVALSLGIKDGVKRQSLSAYKAIQTAYTEKKEGLRETSEVTTPPVSDSTVEYLEEKIANLNIEIDRLNEINEAYKQRFILWQYNAYRNGRRVGTLDDAMADEETLKMLEEPLIGIKRSTGGQ